MTNLEKAVRFIGSVRGRVIIGEALRIALDVYEKRDDVLKPYSNMEDMRFLLEHFAIDLGEATEEAT